MPIDCRNLKRSAVTLIRDSRPRIITAALIYLLLSILFSLLTSNVIGINLTQSGADNYIESLAAGELEQAASYLDNMRPPSGAYLIAGLLDLVMKIVYAGFVLFILNSVRHNEPCFGNLLDGFSLWFKVIMLHIAKTAFIAVYSFLLVLPGIMCIYRYSQALYILLDDPRKGVMQCMRESGALMQGHKTELFRLDLSFIVLFLLTLIPGIGYGVKVWSLPYITTTKALYYEALLNEPKAGDEDIIIQ